MKNVKKFLRVLFSRKISIISFSVIVLFVVMAVFCDVLVPYDPNAINLDAMTVAPNAEHLLGTDDIGRDTLSRIIVGSRITLGIAVVSVFISGSIGCIIGLLAGYYGGIVDTIIMRLMDALLCIPKIALAMTLTFALGRGTFSLMMAIGLSAVPGYVRFIRGQVLSIKNSDYIQAQKIIGTKTSKIIFSEILPNCISPLIVHATTNLGGSIMTEASLSFIGCGVQPPHAAWGSMVEDGFGMIRVYPYLSIYPGLAILLVVLAFNVFGDCLRDALDPRISKSL